jgi:hypothetical protein
MFHPIHEYSDTLRNIYMDDFKASDQFKEFQKRTGRNSISFTKFSEGAKQCPCIQEPGMRVCVDEVETVFGELTTTLANINRKNTTVCECEFCKNEDIKKEELGAGTLLHAFIFSNELNLCLISYCIVRLYTPFGQWFHAS